MAKRTRKTTNRSTPTGKVARTAVAGITAAKIGAKKLGLLSKRPFLTRESFQAQHEKTENEIAEMLFQGLSTLRGGAVKAAQFMSLELDLLPEAYRKELYRSHYQVPPLNRAVVRRLITSELGAPPEEIFDTFDTTAFAAASLGQVHKARSHTGDRLAVKIQYPGIGLALKNDLQLVKQFVLPFIQTEHMVDVVQEFERRLTEETDYHFERRMTQRFYEYGQMDGIVLPRVVEQYSSSHVLTTEFMDGLHLTEWLSTRPSREQRDRAAQAIYDFFTRSIFEFHTVHSDPNPGNYLFRDDGTVAIIDFGSVKIFTPEMCQEVFALQRAIFYRDMEKLIDHYCSFGAAQGDRRLLEEFYHTALVPLGEWARLPYEEEVFDFGKHADYCAQGVRLYGDVVRHKGINGYTAETILFNRTRYGLYRLFTELQARVRMMNQWII